MKKVAILYIGIGKYACFWKRFYISVQRYFLPDTEKVYYVFTDEEHIYGEEIENIHMIYQQDLGWPKNSLYRFAFFNSISQRLKACDYIFFMNANICCNKMISEDEFLPDQEDYVFVLHHAFYEKDNMEYPYERNPESEAYIPYGEGKWYVTGGINGGKTQAFLKLSEKLDALIKKDEEKGIIAIWHDESFINKFVLQHDNYRILSPAYFYPELSGDVELLVDRKIIARDKRKYFDVKGLKKDATLPICEGNKQLSDNHYYRICFKMLILKSKNISLLECLSKYEHIGIYSYCHLGEILINEIDTYGIGNKIDCILDPEADKYSGKYHVTRPYELLHDLDLIIVTDTYHFSEIMTDLSMISDIPIISLEDMVNSSLIKYNIKINTKLW